MTRYVNETIEVKVQVVDSNYDPVTTATVNWKLYDETDVEVDSGTMSHIANGIYTETFTPDAVGEWTFEAYCANPKFRTAKVYNVEISDLLVPAPNSTDNDNERDVIGNKEDTVVYAVGTTKSITAYAKGILDQTKYATRGRVQIFGGNFDCHQAASTYTFATGFAQVVLLESVAVEAQVNFSDDAGFTGISIQTEDGAVPIITSAQGVKANLGYKKQVSWVGAIILQVTDAVQVTIIGGSATDDPSNLQILIKYRALYDGGILG